MENKDKPAYPVRGANGVPINLKDGFPWEQYGIGLSKREYFAAMAMNGLLASQIDRAGHGFPVEIDPLVYTSVQIADNLLNQLENK